MPLGQNGRPNLEKHHKFSIWYVVLGIWAVLILNNFIYSSIGPKNLAYSEFLNQLRSDKVKEIAIGDKVISGTMLDENGKDVSFKTVRVEPDLAKELAGHKLIFRGQVESTFLRTIFSWMVPVLLFMGVWYFMMKRMNPGAGALNFGNNRARVHAEKDIETRFPDVAGVDEAKEELQEIVQFLKTPEKFTVLGGRMPKGVLLVGPSRNRQDAHLPGRGWRGRGSLFRHQRLGVRGDVRGRGRGQGARAFLPGKGKGSLHHLHRRDRRTGKGQGRKRDGRP